MSGTMQIVVTALLVAGAVAYLARKVWSAVAAARRARGPGCGPGCGCD